MRSGLRQLITPKAALALYVVAVGILCHTTPIPESLRAFLSLPSLVILPYLSGFAAVHLAGRLTKTHFDTSQASRLAVVWVFGLLLLTLLGIVLQAANAFRLLYVFAALLALYSVVVSYLDRSTSAEGPSHDSSPQQTRMLLLAILIGVAPALLASFFIHYPFFGINHDTPRAMVQTALRANEEGYLMLAARVPEVLLTSFASQIFNLGPLPFLWAARFALCATFAIGVYLFVYELTHRRSFALAAVFLSSFMMSGGWSHSELFMLYFDIPAQHFKSSTILYALFPWMLLFVERDVLSNRPDIRSLGKAVGLLVVAIAAIFAYAMFPEHVYLGFPPYYKLLKWDPIVLPLLPLAGILMSRLLPRDTRSVFLILFMVMLGFFMVHREETPLFLLTVCLYLLVRTWLSKRSPKGVESEKEPVWRGIPVLVVLSVGLLIGALFVVGSLGLATIGVPGTALGSDTAGLFRDKVDQFARGNGYLVLAPLLIGEVYLIWRRTPVFTAAAVLFGILFLTYLSPVPHIYRIFKEIDPFMAAVIVFAVVQLNGAVRKAKNRLFNVLLVIGLFLLVAAVVYPLYQRFSYRPPEIPPGQDSQTLISNAEYEAAAFIRENAPENARIVSDYFSMWVLTPLANRIWVIPRMMTLEEMSEEGKETLAYIKTEVFQSNDSQSAYEAIYALENRIPFEEEDYLTRTHMDGYPPTYLVILSTRTTHWADAGTGNGIGFSFTLDETMDAGTLGLFSDEHYFTPFYNNNADIYVFEAKPQ